LARVNGAVPHDPVVIMAKRNPAEAVALTELGKFRREFRSARPLASDLDEQADGEFVESVWEFRRWFNGTPRPKKAASDVEGLEELASFYEGSLAPLPEFERLWELAHPKRIEAMRRKTFDLRPYRIRSTSMSQAAHKSPATASSIDQHGHLADVGLNLDLSNKKLGDVRTRDHAVAPLRRLIEDFVPPRPSPTG
jgi:CRISPR-associated exonuclease Cas4